MSAIEYDVAIIGAGPAGYVCAIRCAQLGMKVLCVDLWQNTDGKAALGGTCLNVGCIPSKALLDSSHYFSLLKEHGVEHGIKASDLAFDVSAMQQRKEKIVKTLTTGIAGLFKKNKIDSVHGTATFVSDRELAIEPIGNAKDKKIIRAKYFVIASGSEPIEISVAKTDGNRVVDSTGALQFKDIPKKLGVIGAGVIGLEMSSVWGRLGSQVTILEAISEFLPTVDRDIAAEAYKVLTKQGLDIELASKVEKITSNKNQVLVTYSKDGQQAELQVDKLIVAAGRRANTDKLNLKACGVHADHKGFILVNEHWETSAKNIFAIGDVIGGAMLAHKGSEEGIALAESLVGQAEHVNYSAIPWVIYTWPEIAWVGRTQQELEKTQTQYRVGKFPFMALGRARALGETAGLIKILGDQATDRILGVHIFGPNASELIAEAVLAIEADLSTEDLARTIHAHPSLAEGLHEAALAVDSRAIHI